MDKLLPYVAEVIAAYKEHKVFLLIGGHEPKRVDAAVEQLEAALIAARQPVPV